jgi:hypothetical protein
MAVDIGVVMMTRPKELVPRVVPPDSDPIEVSS